MAVLLRTSWSFSSSRFIRIHMVAAINCKYKTKPKAWSRKHVYAPWTLFIKCSPRTITIVLRWWHSLSQRTDEKLKTHVHPPHYSWSQMLCLRSWNHTSAEPPTRIRASVPQIKGLANQFKYNWREFRCVVGGVKTQTVSQDWERWKRKGAKKITCKWFVSSSREMVPLWSLSIASKVSRKPSRSAGGTLCAQILTQNQRTSTITYVQANVWTFLLGNFVPCNSIGFPPTFRVQCCYTAHVERGDHTSKTSRRKVLKPLNCCRARTISFLGNMDAATVAAGALDVDYYTKSWWNTDLGDTGN